MLHAESLAYNPLTGKACWFVRHIPHGGYGEPYDWGVVVVRRHFFDRCAVLIGHNGDSFNLAQMRQFLGLLRSMGFNQAKAMRRGKWKYYRVI